MVRGLLARVFAFTLIAMLGTSALSAQEPSVRAYLESAEVEVGDRFRVIVEVTGVREIDDVFIPPLFAVSGLPRDGLLPFSTEITTPEPGQTGGSVIFTFSFVARAAGRGEIGPILVTADGRDLETELLTLLVKDPETVTVEAWIEPAEVRVMERFEVHVHFQGVERLLEGPVLRDISDFARRSGSGRGLGEARLNYVALKPGTHEIGPVSVKVGSGSYESEPLTLVVSDEPPVVEAHAALNTEQAWVGGDFVLVVEVEGVPGVDEEPVLPEMSGFARLIDSGWGRGFGGEYYRSGEYRFRALTAGEHEIGPVRIRAGGQAILTEPLHLAIGEAPLEPPVSAEDLRVTTEADKHRVYVGEPVVISYRTLSRSPRWFGEGSWWWEYDSLALPPQEGLEVHRLGPVYGRFGLDDRVSLDGREYSPGAEHRLAVYPREPGRKKIGPAALKGQVRRRDAADFGLTPVERSARFGGNWTPLTLTTDDVSIEVVPLPEVGRPESFRGHVGSLELVCWVDRTNAAPGDTVTLQVELSGPGHSSVMPDPEIAFPAGFDVSEPETVRFDARDDRTGPRGTRADTYLLVAGREGSFRIPAIEVSWFDPESESYGISRAGPFDLTVTPAAEEQGK
ncbi:MAG: BatD family protein [Gemmatimonadota bacterium]|nr:BatD family protein [Gemmatimonadota bacterium]MDE2871042.1 BatD family protein [Gemmatimonadota bacterium]